MKENNIANLGDSGWFTPINEKKLQKSKSVNLTKKIKNCDRAIRLVLNYLISPYTCYYFKLQIGQTLRGVHLAIDVSNICCYFLFCRKYVASIIN